MGAAVVAVSGKDSAITGSRPPKEESNPSNFVRFVWEFSDPEGAGKEYAGGSE
jgi:hypothetical protein